MGSAKLTVMFVVEANYSLPRTVRTLVCYYYIVYFTVLICHLRQKNRIIKMFCFVSHSLLYNIKILCQNRPVRDLFVEFIYINYFFFFTVVGF